MPTPTLAARLGRIMRQQRWSQTKLAEVSGASKQTVSRWLNDGDIKIDPEFAFAIADASGFSARWILLGQGPVHSIDIDTRRIPAELRDEYVRHLHTVATILRLRGKQK